MQLHAIESSSERCEMTSDDESSINPDALSNASSPARSLLDERPLTEGIDECNNNHDKFSPNEGRFVCIFCDQLFNSRKTAFAHYYNHFFIETIVYDTIVKDWIHCFLEMQSSLQNRTIADLITGHLKCNVCDLLLKHEILPNKMNLISSGDHVTHLYTHLHYYPLICEECGWKGIDVNSLDDHLWNKHSISQSYAKTKSQIITEIEDLISSWMIQGICNHGVHSFGSRNEFDDSDNSSISSSSERTILYSGSDISCDSDDETPIGTFRISIGNKKFVLRECSVHIEPLDSTYAVTYTTTPEDDIRQDSNSNEVTDRTDSSYDTFIELKECSVRLEKLNQSLIEKYFDSSPVTQDGLMSRDSMNLISASSDEEVNNDYCSSDEEGIFQMDSRRHKRNQMLTRSYNLYSKLFKYNFETPTLKAEMNQINLKVVDIPTPIQPLATTSSSKKKMKIGFKKTYCYSKKKQSNSQSKPAKGSVASSNKGRGKNCKRGRPAYTYNENSFSTNARCDFSSNRLNINPNQEVPLDELAEALQHFLENGNLDEIYEESDMSMDINGSTNDNCNFDGLDIPYEELENIIQNGTNEWQFDNLSISNDIETDINEIDNETLYFSSMNSTVNNILSPKSDAL
ncbi:hypothetical protein B4U79_17259 [Dinothrombium tinctorium]|uniref:C2H2-type domain-containing protein n=1 Tax=Dinothrombium tinctorium TaxID=1965070 RepID=A0A3S4RDN5_9ACAR|nr:hypothetical protein B4U79_17259 [Dinothrombium tinctorium]